MPIFNRERDELGILEKIRVRRLASEKIKAGETDPEAIAEEALNTVLEQRRSKNKALPDPEVIMKWIDAIMRIIQMVMDLFNQNSDEGPVVTGEEESSPEATS